MGSFLILFLYRLQGSRIEFGCKVYTMESDLEFFLFSHCPSKFSHSDCMEGHFCLALWKEVSSVLHDGKSLRKSRFGSMEAQMHIYWVDVDKTYVQ